MRKIYFLLCLLSTSVISAQQNITFSVDMAGQTFTQAYVSGSFNGWSGDANALTDMGGGIWEATLPIMDGEHEYKFTYDNWAGQDAFNQGDVCTITNYGNHNRRLVVAGSDITLDTAPFGACAESSTNPGPHNVTFTVDMSGYGGSFTNVQINGENHNGQGFGAWCGVCAPILNDMGSGIYSITMPLEEYSYQFKFTLDGWTDQEFFNPGDPFTSTDGTFTNRYISVDGDKSVSYTWADAGQTLSFTDRVTEISEINAYPNPSQSTWNVKSNSTIDSIELFDALGRIVLSVNPNDLEVTLDANNLPKGLYFATVTNELGVSTIKLIRE